MRIRRRSFHPLLLLATICAAAFFSLPFSMAKESERMSPEQAKARLEKGGAVLIDVREPEEWAETGVAGPAVLLPLSDLRGERKQWREFLEQNRDKELLLYCRSGNRSGQAAAILAKEGFRAINAGAFREWKEAGLPTRKP